MYSCFIRGAKSNCFLDKFRFSYFVKSVSKVMFLLHITLFLYHLLKQLYVNTSLKSTIKFSCGTKLKKKSSRLKLEIYEKLLLISLMKKAVLYDILQKIFCKCTKGYKANCSWIAMLCNLFNFNCHDHACTNINIIMDNCDYDKKIRVTIQHFQCLILTMRLI